jgi:hypothetical protein
MVARVSDMNAFHDLYVLFLANRDRGIEFVATTPGSLMGVCFHGSGDRVSCVSRDCAVKLNGERHTSIKGGVGFSQTLHGCFTNVDHRMHSVVNNIHNWVRFVFTGLCLEVVSRGVISYVR